MTPCEAAAIFRIWQQADMYEGLMWKVDGIPHAGVGRSVLVLS